MVKRSLAYSWNRYCSNRSVPYRYTHTQWLQSSTKSMAGHLYNSLYRMFWPFLIWREGFAFTQWTLIMKHHIYILYRYHISCPLSSIYRWWLSVLYASIVPNRKSRSSRVLSKSPIHGLDQDFSRERFNEGGKAVVRSRLNTLSAVQVPREVVPGGQNDHPILEQARRPKSLNHKKKRPKKRGKTTSLGNWSVGENGWTHVFFMHKKSVTLVLKREWGAKVTSQMVIIAISKVWISTPTPYAGNQVYYRLM